MTKAQAAEVVRQWEEEARQSGPAVGTVDHLFATYRGSAHFTGKPTKGRFWRSTSSRPSGGWRRSRNRR